MLISATIFIQFSYSMAYKIYNNEYKIVTVHNKQTIFFPSGINKIIKIFFKAKHKLKILLLLDFFGRQVHIYVNNVLISPKFICAQYGTHITVPKLRLLIRKLKLLRYVHNYI